jgi:hypothetical protein
MTAIVAQGEALTERIAVRAAGPLAPPTSCARQERTDGVHALPDMSIHAASHAARL